MTMISTDTIDADNEKAHAALEADYDHLGEVLARRGVDIGWVKDKVAAYGVAVPSWGVGTGGTITGVGQVLKQKKSKPSKLV